jgi:hypothetical protein
MTSGINKRVDRETEDKGDCRRSESGGGTTHLALLGLSSPTPSEPIGALTLSKVLSNLPRSSQVSENTS